MQCGDVEGPHYNCILQDDWPRRGEDLVKLWNVEGPHYIHISPQNIHITSTIAYFKMTDQGGERTWSNCEIWRCGGSTLHPHFSTKHPHYIHNCIFQDDWPRRGEDLTKLWNVEMWRVHITSTFLHKTSTFLHNVPHNIHKISTFLHITSTFLHNVPHNIHKNSHSSTMFHITLTLFHITSTLLMWKCGFFPTILTNYPFINFIKESNT